MLSIVTTDDESTLDDRVILDTVDRSTAHDVLPAALKTGEETTNQVGRHESLSELVVVLVVDGPDGVLLKVHVLPEPRQSDLPSFLVLVLALPVVNGEGGLAERLDGMLGLGLLFDLVLLVVISGLGLGLGSLLLGLLLLGLLLGRCVLDSLLNELGLTSDSLVDGLVGDGLIPTSDVGVLLAPGSVKDVLKATDEQRGYHDVGKSDTLADEVSVDEEVVFEDLDGLVGGLCAVLDVLLVVWITSNQRAEPASQATENLGVGKGDPSEDGGVVLLGLTEESGLLVLGCDCNIVSRGYCMFL